MKQMQAKYWNCLNTGKSNMSAKKELINKIIYFSTIVFSVLFIYIGWQYTISKVNLFQAHDSTIVAQARAENIVRKVVEPVNVGNRSLEKTTIFFNAHILEGQYKGQSVIVQQINDPIYSFITKEVEPGDKILVCQFFQSTEESEPLWALQEFVRTDALLALLAFFILCVIAFGGIKGFNTIISLIFTCLAIFCIFLPAILAGYSIYASMMIVTAFIIIMTLLLVNGANAKSFSACMGCFGGITVSGILILIMDQFLHLTGIVSEESMHLVRLNPNDPISLKAVMFSAIIIGALGAALDVAVSISAALSEIREKSPSLDYREIFTSGMNIGRDILGTMANTLILVYIGSSLSIILLLLVYSNSLFELLNRELIVIEIMQALIGTTGLLFTIPATSIIYAYMVKKNLV